LVLGAQRLICSGDAFVELEDAHNICKLAVSKVYIAGRYDAVVRIRLCQRDQSPFFPQHLIRKGAHFTVVLRNSADWQALPSMTRLRLPKPI
jgi:hypothetical protein